VMLLGVDRVAMDAVGVAILRMHGGNATISRGRVFDQEQIARAARLGLGATSPDQIDLVTDDGTSVWHSRVEGTSARPPDSAKLDAGAKYFVWVKAFLSGGETVKSAAVSFRIAGQ